MLQCKKLMGVMGLTILPLATLATAGATETVKPTTETDVNPNPTTTPIETPILIDETSVNTPTSIPTTKASGNASKTSTITTTVTPTATKSPTTRGTSNKKAVKEDETSIKPKIKTTDVKVMKNIQEKIEDKTDELNGVTTPQDNETFIKANGMRILKLTGYGDIMVHNKTEENKTKSTTKSTQVKTPSSSASKTSSTSAKNTTSTSSVKTPTSTSKKTSTMKTITSKPIVKAKAKAMAAAKPTIADYFAGKNASWKCEVRSGDAALKDWVAKIRSRILSQFTEVNTIGGYRAGDPQDHGSGNALDVMVPVSSKLGDDIAAWAIKNSQYLNIKYVIWKQRIWLTDSPTSWRSMEDRGGITANHYDHVHLSFNDGAGVCPTN